MLTATTVALHLIFKKHSETIPLNFDLMFANSLFMRLLSASLLLPAEKIAKDKRISKQSLHKMHICNQQNLVISLTEVVLPKNLKYCFYFQ